MQNKILNYLGSIPFLICFAILMTGADVLQRMAFSRKVFSAIYHFLNNGVLVLLKVFCGTRFKFTGLEHLEGLENKSIPKIIISNHQSLMDIAILNVVFKKLNVRFISKRELAKFLPFVSYNLRKMPHCLIDRGDRRQALSTIQNFAANLKANLEDSPAISIFPEGTRARDGKIKAFKPGGFIALLNGLEEALLIPVAISGSFSLAEHKLMPVPFGVAVDVRVLEPLEVKKDAQPKETLGQVFNKIKEVLEDK